MGTKESTQEMMETQVFDLPQDSFQLADHPWLAADVIMEDEIRNGGIQALFDITPAEIANNYYGERSTISMSSTGNGASSI